MESGLYRVVCSVNDGAAVGPFFKAKRWACMGNATLSNTATSLASPLPFIDLEWWYDGSFRLMSYADFEVISPQSGAYSLTKIATVAGLIPGPTLRVPRALVATGNEISFLVAGEVVIQSLNDVQRMRAPCHVILPADVLSVCIVADV